jgi:hypothetical protein
VGVFPGEAILRGTDRDTMAAEGAMAVTYDANVIVTFAERLYRRAAIVVIVYTLFGAVFGALVVKGISYEMHSNSTTDGAIVAAAIIAVLGGLLGNERAFTLRLLAQQALCQVQIERNTRAAAAASSAGAASSPPPPPPSMPHGTW